MEANGISDTKSRLGPAKYVRIDGDRAYVVVPDFYSYTRKGKPVREDLLWTFVATKLGADWKFSADSSRRNLEHGFRWH
jgi:hypothetical protein